MNKRGFTLVEILVVIAIISAIAGIGIPTIKNILRSNLKSSAFQIASLSKFAYDSAVVKGKTHRITFDFDNKTYKLEVAGSEDFLVEQKEDDKENNKDKYNKKNKTEEQKPQEFYAFSGDIGKEHKLSSGVDFDSIENLNTKKKYTEDVAYVYFFPQGETEDVIIRLSGKKSNTGFYSIRLNPLNGKAKIEGRYLEAEE